MVVDGTRIPVPAPSRSRIARPASRIPTRTALTPRRASATPADDKPASGIPTPRRASRDPADPARRTSRTPGKPKPADRSDPPSRTPRRAAAARPSLTADDAAAKPSGIPTPRRLSREPAPRRLSKEPAPTRLSKEPVRVGVPRFGSRLSTNHNEPPTSRQRIARDLPDRGMHTFTQPSPARRTSNQPPRPGLKASPYTRRASAGASARAAAGPVTRKLNMGEEEPRRLSNAAGPGRTSLPGARRTSIPGARDRLTDRVERRRESGGGASRPGISALESFRAARRASQEAAAAEKVTKPDVVMTDAPPEEEVPVAPEQALPDRTDPLMPTKPPAPVITPSRPRRRSTRFSEADINLEDVERLRQSLGRRRSRGVGEKDPETPQLRRSSLGRRYEEMLAEGLIKEEKGPGPSGERQRSPLKAIEANCGNVQSNENQNSRAEKRQSKVPDLGDEELGWANEEVEDLGAW